MSYTPPFFPYQYPHPQGTSLEEIDRTMKYIHDLKKSVENEIKEKADKEKAKKVHKFWPFGKVETFMILAATSPLIILIYGIFFLTLMDAIVHKAQVLGK